MRLFDEFERILVVDTETTGLDSAKNDIIELAFLEMDSEGQVLREYDRFLKLPEGAVLPEKITELTGITSEMLLGEGIAQETAAGDFGEVLRPGTLLAAYNAQFDLCFLYYFLKRFGDPAGLKNLKFLDLLTVYRDRQPYPHKLCNAIETYHLDSRNTHRAIDDTAAAAELMMAMAAEKDDLVRYVNLFGYLPKYGVSGPKIRSVTYLPQKRQGKLLYELKA